MFTCKLAATRLPIVVIDGVWHFLCAHQSHSSGKSLAPYWRKLYRTCGKTSISGFRHTEGRTILVRHGNGHHPGWCRRQYYKRQWRGWGRADSSVSERSLANNCRSQNPDYVAGCGTGRRFFLSANQHWVTPCCQRPPHAPAPHHDRIHTAPPANDL